MEYIDLMFWATGHTVEAWCVSKPGSLKKFHIAKSNIEDLPVKNKPSGRLTVAVKKWVAEENDLI